MKDICGRCGAIDSYKEVTEGGRSFFLFLLMCLFMIIPGLLYWGFAKKKTVKSICKECGIEHEKIAIETPKGKQLYDQYYPKSQSIEQIEVINSSSLGKKTWHGLWDYESKASKGPKSEHKNAGMIVFLSFAGVFVLIGGVLNIFSSKPEVTSISSISPLPVQTILPVATSQPKQVEPAKEPTTLEKHTQFLDKTQNFIDSTQKKLKKYYATDDDYKKCLIYGVALKEIQAGQQSTLEIKNKADKLTSILGSLCKNTFASFYEESLRKMNINANVHTSGTGSNTLNIKYSLMSEQMVYIFRNKAEIDEMAKDAGFKKIIFTDGYSSNWSVKLD